MDDFPPQTCGRCSESEDECLCMECTNCGHMTDSVCEGHDRCDDCSTDAECCDYAPRCDHCDEHMDNCDCYLCGGCGERQSEPLCQHDLCESCQVEDCHCNIPRELRTPDGL